MCTRDIFSLYRSGPPRPPRHVVVLNGYVLVVVEVTTTLLWVYVRVCVCLNNSDITTVSPPTSFVEFFFFLIRFPSLTVVHDDERVKNVGIFTKYLRYTRGRHYYYNK